MPLDRRVEEKRAARPSVTTRTRTKGVEYDGSEVVSSSPTSSATKRFKTVENATAVIWKTLLFAEKILDASTRRSCSWASRAAWLRRRLDARTWLPDLIYTQLDETANPRSEGDDDDETKPCVFASRSRAPDVRREARAR